MTYPYPLPWPPSPVALQKDVYDSPTLFSPTTVSQQSLCTQALVAFRLSLPIPSHLLPGSLYQKWPLEPRAWILQQGCRGRASSTKDGRHTTLPLYQLGQFSIRLNWHFEGIPSSPPIAIEAGLQCQLPFPLGPAHSWCLLQLPVPYLTPHPSFPCPRKEAAPLYVVFI